MSYIGICISWIIQTIFDLEESIYQDPKYLVVPKNLVYARVIASFPALPVFRQQKMISLSRITFNLFEIDSAAYHLAISDNIPEFIGISNLVILGIVDEISTFLVHVWGRGLVYAFGHD